MDGGNTSFRFPLSQLPQPSRAQSFTAIVFSNQPSDATRKRYFDELAKVQEQDQAWLESQQKQGLVSATVTVT